MQHPALPQQELSSIIMIELVWCLLLRVMWEAASIVDVWKSTADLPSLFSKEYLNRRGNFVECWLLNNMRQAYYIGLLVGTEHVGEICG